MAENIKAHSNKIDMFGAGVIEASTTPALSWKVLDCWTWQYAISIMIRAGGGGHMGLVRELSKYVLRILCIHWVRMSQPLLILADMRMHLNRWSKWNVRRICFVVLSL